MRLHSCSIFSAPIMEEHVMSLSHDWCVGVDLHKDMLPASIRYIVESGAITFASMHFTLG